MHPSRIVALLDPFLGPPNAQRLTPAALLDISTYIDILLRWNARINLTAIRDPEDIVPRHFGESFFAARHLFPKVNPPNNVGTAAPGCPAERSSAAAAAIENAGESTDVQSTDIPNVRRPTPDARCSVADIGSGAGFPGLPLKLWAPHIALTLIESNQKKSTFLREVARALTLTDVNIQNTRAEALTGTTFDLVTLRAVEHFEAILPTAATLVAPGGRLALLISSAQVDPARTSLPPLSWSDPIPVPQSRSRILLIANRPTLSPSHAPIDSISGTTRE